MLIPGRLRIAWKDEQTLQVEMDAGMQTRLLHFKPDTASDTTHRSWQGYSAAQWIPHKVVPMLARPGPSLESTQFGSLKIITDKLLPGLIRKNGLPYSDQASLTEFWKVYQDPVTQIHYLIVTAALRDPQYLTREYYYTATFQKESNGSKWNPTPCDLMTTP